MWASTLGVHSVSPAAGSPDQLIGHTPDWGGDGQHSRKDREQKSKARDRAREGDQE